MAWVNIRRGKEVEVPTWPLVHPFSCFTTEYTSDDNIKLSGPTILFLGLSKAGGSITMTGDRANGTSYTSQMTQRPGEAMRNHRHISMISPHFGRV